MNEEIAEALGEIAQFFLTASDAGRKYRELSPDARARLPESLRARFESLAE